MTAAVVLPFSNDRSNNICDFESQILEAGVAAVRDLVEVLMDYRDPEK